MSALCIDQEHEFTRTMNTCETTRSERNSYACLPHHQSFQFQERYIVIELNEQTEDDCVSPYNTAN